MKDEDLIKLIKDNKKANEKYIQKGIDNDYNDKNKTLIFNIFKTIMILLLIVSISIFFRYIYADLFTSYDGSHDGTLDGLEYIFIILPLTIITSIVTICKFFNSIENINKIFIIILILDIINVYSHYINIILILCNIFFVIFIYFSYKNKDYIFNKHSFGLNAILIIISIITLLTFPSNPADYEKWASKDATWTYEYEINRYLEKNNSNSNIVKYETEENTYEMEKKVTAYIENGKIIKATIEYKNIIYEYENNNYKKHYKDKYIKLKDDFLKLLYHNFI